MITIVAVVLFVSKSLGYPLLASLTVIGICFSFTGFSPSITFDQSWSL